MGQRSHCRLPVLRARQGLHSAGSGFGDQNIGLNPNPSFGQINQIDLDLNFHREYQWQYSLGVQHELLRGVNINAGWTKTANYQPALVLTAVPFSAYTPAQILNPLDGSPITVYNLPPAVFGLPPRLHQTMRRLVSDPILTTDLKYPPTA